MARRIPRMYLLIAHLCGPPADILWPEASEWFYGHIASLTGLAVSNSFGERACLMGDERYAKALRTIVDAMKPPLRETNASHFLDFMSDLLTYLASATVNPRRITCATLDKICVKETGTTWRTLRRFPARMEGMAAEIERIDAFPLFKLKESSASLRRDAAHLKELLERPVAVSTEPRSRTPPLYDLICVVRSWTGRPHDKEVIELLHAADLALNPGAKEREPRFDTQTLLDLRSRLKRELLRT